MKGGVFSRKETARKKLSCWLLILSLPLVYVLQAAAVVKVAVGGYLDASVIAVILLFMAAIGYFLDTRSEIFQATEIYIAWTFLTLL